MRNSQALVTLAIGARHRDPWMRVCRANWSRYAERHGYDVICIDRPLDTSDRARARTPAWQKCLVLDQPFAARYDQVVWVDADVLINPAAPSITEQVPAEQAGAVDEFSTPTRALSAKALATLYRHWELNGREFVRNHTGREYYAAYGLPPRFDAVVQTGVIVLSPRHHRELLLSVYHDYDDIPGPMGGEMRALSYELLSAGVVGWLDPRFNHSWMRYKALHYPFLLNRPDHPRAAAAITEALRNVYFLHCTSNPSEMSLARSTTAAGSAATTSPRPAKATASTPHGPLGTPVVLFVYSRPDTARLVLESVRSVRPRKLMVVADGPAPGASRELLARVAAARRVIEGIDWGCEVLTEFASEHLGLSRRLVSGLDWAFSQTEEAIVLEDDCAPEPTFFRFCEELLARHRDDPRVMGISGNDFSSDPQRRGDHYRYSRYSLTWGWATWRRAWELHDPEMKRWPELRDAGWLDQLLGDRHAVAYWTRMFERTYSERDAWDYAWKLTCWLHGGLYVHPEVNLVTNVGFGQDATHTRDVRSVFANLPTRPARFPLAHPPKIVVDEEGDRFLEDVMYSGNLAALFERIRRGRSIARGQAVR